MRNKKGIMLKFFLTVLLAIIIFMPACYVSSKFFRLSDQSKDNFIEVVNEIKTLKDEEKKSVLVILDKGTGIVYFEPGQTEVKVHVDASGHTDYLARIVNSLGKCDPNKGCLCLLRKPEYELSMTEIRIEDKSMYCKDFDENLKMDDCSIGIPENINSQTCLNGFMVERHLLDEASALFPHSYYKNGRRISVLIHKEGDTIYFQG